MLPKYGRRLSLLWQGLFYLPLTVHVKLLVQIQKFYQVLLSDTACNLYCSFTTEPGIMKFVSHSFKRQSINTCFVNLSPSPNLKSDKDNNPYLSPRKQVPLGNKCTAPCSSNANHDREADKVILVFIKPQLYCFNSSQCKQPEKDYLHSHSSQNSRFAHWGKNPQMYFRCLVLFALHITDIR